MKVVAGLVMGVLLPFVALGVVVATGAFDMTASRPPGPLERLVAATLTDRSVERRAPKRKNPLPQTPETLRAGLEHYREHCFVCHGAPRLPLSDVARGLNPPAPDLASPDAQEASDGELHYVIAHGIRMSGMPAFQPSHSEKEIWEIVSFVRHLRSLSPEEREALRTGHKP